MLAAFRQTSPPLIMPPKTVPSFPAGSQDACGAVLAAAHRDVINHTKQLILSEPAECPRIDAIVQSKLTSMRSIARSRTDSAAAKSTMQSATEHYEHARIHRRTQSGLVNHLKRAREYGRLPQGGIDHLKEMYRELKTMTPDDLRTQMQPRYMKLADDLGLAATICLVKARIKNNARNISSTQYVLKETLSEETSKQYSLPPPTRELATMKRNISYLASWTSEDTPLVRKLTDQYYERVAKKRTLATLRKGVKVAIGHSKKVGPEFIESLKSHIVAYSYVDYEVAARLYERLSA